MFEREPGINPEQDLWREVLRITVDDALLGPTGGGVGSKITRARIAHQARAYLTRAC